MTIRQYVQGELVTFPLVVRDSGGLLADPDSIAFGYRVGSLHHLLTWDGHTSTAAPGSVWRTAKGRYWAQVDTTPMTGVLNGGALTTGNVQAAQINSINILPNPAIGA